MLPDEEITALIKTPDSEDEMTRIMAEVLQPRRTHTTESSGAFPDVESALEFVRHQLMTVDQARTNEPPTRPSEPSAVTDSIVVTIRRIPPQTGSIVPYESSPVPESVANQIAAPLCQNLPAFPTHQPGESSGEPAPLRDVLSFLVDDYPVTPEYLDDFHAVPDYLSEPYAVHDSKTSHPASEFYDLTSSSSVNVAGAAKETIYLPYHLLPTGPYHREVPEYQNLSASPTHQRDAPFAQPALEALNVSMDFTDGNPVSQEVLKALQEASSGFCEPSSPSYFDIRLPASPGPT